MIRIENFKLMVYKNELFIALSFRWYPPQLRWFMVDGTGNMIHPDNSKFQKNQISLDSIKATKWHWFHKALLQENSHWILPHFDCLDSYFLSSITASLLFSLHDSKLNLSKFQVSALLFSIDLASFTPGAKSRWLIGKVQKTSRRSHKPSLTPSTHSTSHLSPQVEPSLLLLNDLDSPWVSLYLSRWTTTTTLGRVTIAAVASNRCCNNMGDLDWRSRKCHGPTNSWSWNSPCGF